MASLRVDFRVTLTTPRRRRGAGRMPEDYRNDQYRRHSCRHMLLDGTPERRCADVALRADAVREALSGSGRTRGATAQ